jgi:hypothetical protein
LILLLDDEIERFMNKFTKNPGGCWEWTSAMGGEGYGNVTLRKLAQRLNRRSTSFRAHRISWMIHKGPIPEGMFVMHKCDNRICVNPEHLCLGTHQDNMDDMMKKGRHRTAPQYGNKHAARKVIADHVEYESYTAAGKALGVSDNAIRKRIAKGWDGYSLV